VSSHSHGRSAVPGELSGCPHGGSRTTAQANHIIACYTTDHDGHQHYQAFHYTLA
jgi:hypothetical protein